MRFIQPFLFGLGAFAILIFLGDMFDKMPRLIRSHAHFPVILAYLWLEVPYWGVRVIPMATLLATLFAVTGFIQSGEWIAVQASGVETRLFFRPVLFLSIAVAALSLAAQESLLPACYRGAQRLWRERISAESQWDRYNDIMVVPGMDRFVTAQALFVKEGIMLRPIMDYYGSGGIVLQVDAKQASWDPKGPHWVFHDGVVRVFGSGVDMTEKPFESFVSDIAAPPKSLIPRDKNPDEMTILELRRYLKEARALGGSAREARAELQSKIAYPFANIVLCALGIPIAMRLGRASRVISFTLALAVSFVYLWVSEMGRAMGSAGWLPPVIGAWLAPVLFGAAALRMSREQSS